MEGLLTAGLFKTGQVHKSVFEVIIFCFLHTVLININSTLGAMSQMSVPIINKGNFAITAAKNITVVLGIMCYHKVTDTRGWG